MSKIILANLPAPPPSPAPGTIAVYAQGDTLFSINSSGVVSSLGGGGGGVTVSGSPNQGIGVTGGPAYVLSLSVTPQVAGTIIYRNAANTQWVGLSPGANGEVLTLAGGVPTWAAAGGGGVTVSAATDQGLSVTGGPAYSLALSVPSQTTGTIIYRNASNQWVGLNPGTNGQVLTLAGGVPTWAAAGGGGVTINTAAPLAGGAGPATTFNLSFAFAGQQPGDMAILDDDGVTWQRLARGVGATPSAPFALFDAGGAVSPSSPTNGVQWASVAFLLPSAGNGITVTGGNTINIGFAGEASGDMIYNNGGTWARLPTNISQAGYYLKVDSTGLPVWSADIGVLDIFVNSSTGSDANDGLTPGTAFLTLDRAMQLVPRDALKAECTIHCAGNVPVQAKVGSMPHWIIPGGGPMSYMLVIDADITVLFPWASLTVTGGTQGSNAAFGTITFSGTPFVGNLSGKVLRCVNMSPDPNFVAGECFRIHSNTSNSITIVGAFPGAINPGVSVEVGEELVIEFPANVTPTDVPSIMGGPILLSGVKFDFKDNAAVFNSVSVFTNVAGITGNAVGGGQLLMTRSQMAGIKAPSSNVRGHIVTAVLEANRYCGPFFGIPVYAEDSSTLNFHGVRSEGLLRANRGSAITIQAASFGDKGRCVAIYSSSVNLTEVAVAGSTSSSPLTEVIGGSSGVVSYVDGTGYSGAVLEALENSFVRADALIGTVGNSYAVKAHNHSRIVVSDANTGTTIVGSGGAGAAVVVGNNAATSWALIAGMATADVVDLAATPPTFSAITTA
jgi:hypothetical protein